ncbi:hypothetical protein GCM10020218_015300 [Dactylosporangium vinaceum]
MRARGRWITASLLTLVAALAVAFVIVAASNPWHYTALMPWGRTGVAVSILLVAISGLVLAAVLVVRGVRGRIGLTGGAIVLALAVMGGGVLYGSLDFVDTDRGPAQVAAVSPSGRYELVAFRGSALFGGHQQVIRVRSRAGLGSREAGENLACFMSIDDGWPAPDKVLSGVRFTGETAVEVTTKDGATWQTSFDPGTLLAVSRLSKGCE